MTNGTKSSNLVKSHELIFHFIRLYLVPLPPQGSGGDSFLEETLAQSQLQSTLQFLNKPDLHCCCQKKLKQQNFIANIYLKKVVCRTKEYVPKIQLLLRFNTHLFKYQGNRRTLQQLRVLAVRMSSKHCCLGYSLISRVPSQD